MSTVKAVYRGWVGPSDAGGGLVMTSEGLILPRLRRDIDRFGRTVRVRYFAANTEFSAAMVKDERWQSRDYHQIDDKLRVDSVELPKLLENLTAKFVQLEIEWLV